MRLALALLAAASATLTYVQPAPAAVLCEKDDEDDPDPVIPGTSSLVSYLTITNPSYTDTRASWVTIRPNPAHPEVVYKTWKVDLKGYLFVPSGSYMAPTIVFSHGGSDAAMPPCAIVKYFVSRGYIVFAPLRRGESPLTGQFIDTWVDNTCPGCTGDEKQYTIVDYFRMQAEDVKAAAIFARNRPYVSRTAIALMGHSNGGIVSLLANQAPSGPFMIVPAFRAVVDISAGGLSWGSNVAKREALEEAAGHAITTIYFLHGEDEPYTEPAFALAWIASAIGKFGGLEYIPDASHVNMAMEDATVALWGPGALEFLAEYLY